MITLKNVKTLSDSVVDQFIESQEDFILDCESRLLMIPALIDTAAFLDKDPKVYLEAGISTVFDSAPLLESELVIRNKALSRTPFHTHYFYNGDSFNEKESLGKIKPSVAGITLSLDKDFSNNEKTNRLFQLAAQENMILNISLLGNREPKKNHLILETIFSLAEKYNTEISLQNVKTKESVDMIRQAKKSSLLIYGETAFPYLFFDDTDFLKLDFPSKHEQEALWEGVDEGTIEMVGSAEHFLSGQLLVPLMLERYREKKISLNKIIDLTRINSEEIFRLKKNNDFILIDETTKRANLNNLFNKLPIPAKWKDKKLSGFPLYTFTKGKLHFLS